jgi:dihydroorotate dehydrogenase electron transfer subunit
VHQIEAEVISNSPALVFPGSGYYLLHLDAPSIASNALPGQFCMLQCGTGALLRRPLSIHATSEDGRLTFLFSVPAQAECQPGQGKGKTWLSRLAKGDTVNIIGPLGNAFHIDDKSNKILLAAGGIGVAPLGFLAEAALARGKQVTLLLGARTNESLYPCELLPSGIIRVGISESSDGNGLLKGLITDALPAYYGQADYVYACGPKAMLQAIGNQVQSLGITAPVQVSLEVRMGCGTGLCYGCSIRTRLGMKRVCKEGPIFDIKDIIWQEVIL